MIQFANVSKIYPNGYPALQAINFSIDNGECILLHGPSGSGKTTLFNLLLGLTQPSQGNIFVRQQNIAHLTQKQLPYLRRHISIVAQNPQLLPQETVFNNVALPLYVTGYHAEYIKTRVSAALKKVGLLHKSHLHATALSSGEQKRTEVARAIVTTPQILLVDEPTANVDEKTATDMLALFNAFHQIGITVIIASHQANLLNHEQTRSLSLCDGKIHGDLYATTKEKI